MVRRILFALVLLALPRSAFAQSEHTGGLYASALLAIPWSQGLTEDGFQIYRLPPGGWSLGWSVLGGVFVSPRASVEFEVTQTGVLERTEPSRYNYTYHPQRQDTFFTTAVRLHARPQRLVDIEPVLGFDIVRETVSDAADWVDTGGHAHQSPRYGETLPAAAGFAVGADLRIGSGTAAFVAAFRVHRTFWGGSGDFDETKLWTLHPSAGLRVSF